MVTGVECSGKTTLSQALAQRLGWAWVPEHARTHADVVAGKVQESTFDELHESQTAAAATARSTHPGVVCDTGDLVLRMWSEAVLEFSWHPLLPPDPRVDLHILCPTLPTWEEDPCAPCLGWKTGLHWKKNTGPISPIGTTSSP